MPQFLRPSSNITQNSWTGGFAEIDEATADDGDFAYGANNSSAATLEVLMSGVNSADVGTCTVRWRHAKVAAGTLSGTGGTVNQTVGVYQGTTLVQSSTVTTGGTWTDASFTFDSSSITDWADVRVRFNQTASGGGGNARGSAVSWVEIETPDFTLFTVVNSTSNASGEITVGKQLAATEVVSVNCSAEIIVGVPNPLNTSIDVSATTDATITNIFPVSASVVVEIDSFVTMDEVTKEVSANHLIQTTIFANLIIDHSCESSVSSIVVAESTLAVLKQLEVAPALTATVNIDAFLVQEITVSGNLLFEAGSFATILNASEGFIQGTIRDNIGNPIQRTIYLYRRSDGEKIAETISNISTGEYQFITPPAQIQYMVVVKEDGEAHVGNDQIRGRIVPYVGL